MPVSFSFDENGFVHLCAHRGYSTLYPENTMAAFEGARLAGATSCELDIKLSADDEVLVLHDMLLDRTTDGTGYASDWTWRDIARLDAGSKTSRRFAGEPIPLFADVVRWAKANSFGLIVELKDWDRPERLARRFVDVLDDTDGFDCVMALGFDHVLLASVKAMNPRVRTEVIVHARHADLVGVLRACNADGASIELRTFHPDDARALHEAGYLNRLSLPHPSVLAERWLHGRDALPDIASWIKEGLIDSIASDDVPFLKRIAKA